MSGVYVIILAGLGTTSGSDVWVYVVRAYIIVYLYTYIYIYIWRLQRDNTGPS